MIFALGAHVMCFAAITGLVGLSGFGGVVLMLALFFARQVAESVVFLLGVAGGAVVEGCAAEAGLGVWRHDSNKCMNVIEMV